MNSPAREDDTFYLSEVSPKDKPWDEHRARADSVRDLYKDSDFSDYSRRIQECSQLLQFIFKAKDDGEVALRLYAARFCRVRHCPVCTWRRSLMWRARFFELIPRLQKDYPTAKYLFLTLTVKNCPVEELRETLTWMNNSWRRMTERKRFPAIGFLKSVEVTRPEAGWAHPHFHAVLMVHSNYFTKNYIPHAEWLKLWQSCLRVDYPPSVRVQMIKSKRGKAIALENEIAVALCETLKYSIKGNDLVADQDWLHEVTRQLHKTRAVSVGGVFRQYLSDEEPEDLIGSDSADDEAAADDSSTVTFGWREAIAKYVKK